MALATTCPQCKTSFKVIPDQLKLRRGLVRCGVCQHVFSGIDYLRYVDDSAKGRSAATPPVAPPPAPPASPGARGRAGGPAAPERPGAGGPMTRLPPHAVAAAGASPASPGSPRTIISSDDELKTAFFLSDSTFGPYSQTRPQDVVPPSSIVSGEEAAGSGDFARDFFQDGAAPNPTPPAAPAPRAVVARGDSKDRSTRESARDPATGHLSRSAGEPREAGRPTPRTPSREGRRDPFPAVAPDAAGDDATRQSRSRRSLMLDDEEDDPDVAAANTLARQARDAYRHGGASSRRTSSRSGSLRSHHHDPRHDNVYQTFSDLLSDPRRRIAVVALVVLALLQLTLLFRSEMASRAPSLRPALGVLAGVFGMNVDTVRSLPSLSIESFELQTTGRPDRIALNAVLRNRDGHAVRWPAMELTLTDQASAVVVRKVIMPADYLNRTAPRDGLGGRSEWPIRLGLDTGGLQLAGYSVALFYP